MNKSVNVVGSSVKTATRTSARGRFDSIDGNAIHLQFAPMRFVDLEDYELRERLGTGTVGAIFLAIKKGTDEVYAVKFLSHAVSSNDLIVSRFNREMLILERLDHPNILAYYGGGKHDDQLFYVMEYIKGGTLKDLLTRTGPLTWQEAAESARQIAAALQHAHNHGIIHRDLKPGNVFITETGELKLGDFGIARDTHAHDLTDAGLTVGTYSYMAPELVRGERGITGLVDLYALGCLLFELLTGRPPYQGDNFAQIFDQHLKSEPPSVIAHGVNCPPEIDQLIRELLFKDPENRPFNARAVQGLLGHLLHLDESTGANEAGVADRSAAEVNVSSAAKELLSARVAEHAGDRPEVAWSRLIGLLVAIALAIIVAMLANR